MPKERPQRRGPLARQDDRGIDVRLGGNRVQKTIDAVFVNETRVKQAEQERENNKNRS